MSYSRNLRDKFHIYLEKLRVAVQAERDFGSQDERTISYYKIANASKLEFVDMLTEIEEWIEENEC